jgi:hypothetical protein
MIFVFLLFVIVMGVSIATTTTITMVSISCKCLLRYVRFTYVTRSPIHFIIRVFFYSFYIYSMYPPTRLCIIPVLQYLLL